MVFCNLERLMPGLTELQKAINNCQRLYHESLSGAAVGFWPSHSWIQELIMSGNVNSRINRFPPRRGFPQPQINVLLVAGMHDWFPSSSAKPKEFSSLPGK